MLIVSVFQTEQTADKKMSNVRSHYFPYFLFYFIHITSRMGRWVTQTHPLVPTFASFPCVPPAERNDTTVEIIGNTVVSTSKNDQQKMQSYLCRAGLWIIICNQQRMVLRILSHQAWTWRLAETTNQPEKYVKEIQCGTIPHWETTGKKTMIPKSSQQPIYIYI